jgi:hypothetical protein
MAKRERRTDNTMAKRERAKGLTTIYKSYNYRSSNMKH